MYVYIKKILLIVAKLVSLTNAYEFYLTKSQDFEYKLYTTYMDSHGISNA